MMRSVRSVKVPDAELEVFIHEPCISYSGRCLLSNYVAGRDANQGDCAHPCRWRYHLVEEKDPGNITLLKNTVREPLFLIQKTFAFCPICPNSSSGVTSLKIEGRVKSSFYVRL